MSRSLVGLVSKTGGGDYIEMTGDGLRLPFLLVIPSNTAYVKHMCEKHQAQ